MPAGALTVGELARRAGVSVRALHHYDAIGLLRPARRSRAGHRLYGPAEIARLQQIRSLQQLGLSLEEIRHGLGRAEWSLLAVIERQRDRLRARLALEQRLVEQLDGLARLLRTTGQAGTEDLLRVLETMAMIERHHTPKQLEYLRQRAAAIGQDRIKEVEAEWPRLIGEVRALYDTGVAPSDPRAQALAARWRALVQEFSGGNRAIEENVARMYRENPDLPAQYGLDPGMGELMGYIERIERARPAAPGAE